PEGPPEIAFLGRSNVGKSSAINRLAGRKRLAFASKTPGRTQTVNFYGLGEFGRLVDLPGYGYARVPHAERAKWERLVTGYLLERHTLAGVVIVMDARHPLTPQDHRLLEWLAPLAVRRLALLTKADKLSRTEGARLLSQTRRTVADALLFSSLDRQGVEQARDRLAQWLLEARSGSRK
ncbi:MAG: YihA family ribosome biogenesis GTP-binding protein, partial [Betaproteobacteria bacterium]